MADYRHVPKSIKPSKTEGDFFRTIGGVAAWGSLSVALPEYVVSVTNGVPYIMFDADGTPVTEG